MTAGIEPFRIELNQIRQLLGTILSELRELREARAMIEAAGDGRAPKLAYTIEEAIAATGIGRTVMYEAIRSGALKAQKRGRSTIILAAALAEYVASLPRSHRGDLR